MEFTEWLESVTDDSQNDVAKKIGMPRRTLQNQLYGTPKMETIVKIADTYGMNPHRALTELGYVAPHWLRDLGADVDAALLAATEQQLGDEVVRRMLRGVETEALTTPVDELADRRSNASTPSVSPLDDDRAVADSSDDEPEEGTDFD